MHLLDLVVYVCVCVRFCDCQQLDNSIYLMNCDIGLSSFVTQCQFDVISVIILFSTVFSIDRQ
jgi:hypothetical protein